MPYRLRRPIIGVVSALALLATIASAQSGREPLPDWENPAVLGIRKVGYSQGSKTPAELDVTDFVRGGANTLAVEVYRWSDGACLDGRLRVRAWVESSGRSRPPPARVEIDLLTPDGRSVLEKPLTATAWPEPDGETVVEVTQTIRRPRLRSAETPDLYTVTVVPVGVDEANIESHAMGYSVGNLQDSWDVIVRVRMIPGDDDLPYIPRVGTPMTLPTAFGRMTWYGRGPRETYWDRRTGAKIGVYAGDVMDPYVPYVRPQENGNKTDVRWVAPVDARGHGMPAVGMPLPEVSAHRFTVDDFDPGTRKRQRHTYHLKPRDFVSLDLDLHQMGVGGDHSWGARPDADGAGDRGDHDRR